MGAWHEFYALLGAASATMVGLLFVAASVGSGVFTVDRRAALRMFLSASVVHFSSTLVVCLIVLAPIESGVAFGLLIAGCGVFGLAYSAMAWRDTVNDGLIQKIDLEDRTWYAVLPSLVYLFEAASGVMLAMNVDDGRGALAVSVGLLLVVGIHNAWDITVWSMSRRSGGSSGG
jgi:hypothetical protein